MMQYTRIPRSAELEREIVGTNAHGLEASVRVFRAGAGHRFRRYAEYRLDGDLFYVRQFSGRNLQQLEDDLHEIRCELLTDVRERIALAAALREVGS